MILSVVKLTGFHMNQILTEFILMTKHSVDELSKHSVHVVRMSWERSLQEPNVSAVWRHDNSHVLAEFCLFHWDRCRIKRVVVQIFISVGKQYLSWRVCHTMPHMARVPRGLHSRGALCALRFHTCYRGCNVRLYGNKVQAALLCSVCVFFRVAMQRVFHRAPTTFSRAA